MMGNKVQKENPVEILLNGLMEQNKCQAKIISMQEETIKLKTKQNEELSKLLNTVIETIKSYK